MTPRLRIAVVAVAAVLLAGGIWGIIHANGANERHVNDLIALGYESSGFDDQPDPKLQGYDRDDFEGACGSATSNQWIGTRTATRFDPEVDWFAGAPRASDAFSSDGWDVTRWEPIDGSGPVRMVLAQRGDDRLLIVYDRASVTLRAASGRCVPALEDSEPQAGYDVVNEFTPIAGLEANR